MFVFFATFFSDAEQTSRWNQFVESIKSKLTVKQVVDGVRSGGQLSFDYLALIVTAEWVEILNKRIFRFREFSIFFCFLEFLPVHRNNFDKRTTTMLSVYLQFFYSIFLMKSKKCYFHWKPQMPPFIYLLIVFQIETLNFIIFQPEIRFKSTETFKLKLKP